MIGLGSDKKSKYFLATFVLFSGLFIIVRRFEWLFLFFETKVKKIELYELTIYDVLSYNLRWG